jgi:hypothetical protein
MARRLPRTIRQLSDLGVNAGCSQRSAAARALPRHRQHDRPMAKSWRRHQSVAAVAQIEK